MRWILAAIVCLSLALNLHAAGPEDDFVDIFNTIQQAQSLETSSQTNAAARTYQQALTSLQQLQTEHPSWNPDVVKFRLEFLQEKMARYGKFLPPTNTVPAAVTPPSSPPDPTAALRAQIEALMTANNQLQQKLKEALSVQPVASPEDLAKSQARVAALEKENELLNVTLQQQKNAKPAAPPEPKVDVAKLNDQLAAATSQAAALNKTVVELMAKQAEANNQINALKSAQQGDASKWSDQLNAAKNQTASLNDTVADLRKKLDDANNQTAALKSQLSDANNQISTLKAAPATPPGEDPQQLKQERDQLKTALDQRTKDLAEAEARAAELKATPPPPPPAQPAPAPSGDSENSKQQIAQLRSRLAVLEATPVPYTPEELAVLNSAPAKSPAAVAPKPVPASAPSSAANSPASGQRKVHSSKDLPPGAGALMADASRDAQDRDFKGAEEKYNEILRQDENNVYVLAHLASIQFQAGEIPECEKTVERAVGLDPEDPATLYLLGILRYRQERLDEALDALSRSAAANPTNSGTQNFLGCVLSDKGQRPAAETAFRKALQIDPDYADAHYNLAFVYATEKPASLALARWHYKRATDLGHPHNEQLEKLLAAGK